jgi:hypothetical protein
VSSYAEKRGTQGRSISWQLQRCPQPAILGPKPTKISFFPFLFSELQSVGLLPSMAQVHLLLHAGWWDHLVRLGWAVAKGERNVFISSQ